MVSSQPYTHLFIRAPVPRVSNSSSRVCHSLVHIMYEAPGRGREYDKRRGLRVHA
jgi:hypothetical protein